MFYTEEMLAGCTYEDFAPLMTATQTPSRDFTKLNETLLTGIANLNELVAEMDDTSTEDLDDVARYEAAYEADMTSRAENR